ncbi:hypothetical protein AAVH_24020 [Aphelenchoides avenae]|nr:hypothetical protein AAVH_24020 [Aphelenchus avenae]
MRSFVAVALVLVSAIALSEAMPTLFELTPSILKPLLPTAVKKELKNLDMGDVEGLVNVLKQYKSIDSFPEFLQKLKPESPGIHDILKSLYSL